MVVTLTHRHALLLQSVPERPIIISFVHAVVNCYVSAIWLFGWHSSLESISTSMVHPVRHWVLVPTIIAA